MPPESEWQTRKTRIDARLKALSPSWEIIRFRENLDTSKLSRHAVEEYPTDNGPADYAFFVDGKLLGILEAKRVSVNPQNVLEQAKRYAQGVPNGVGNWNGLKVPFLYSSNGELIWFLDTRTESHTSRQIANFHTSAALAEMFAKKLPDELHALRQLDIEKIPRLRPYQKDAITAIENGISKGRKEMLVAMATGTGKTYMTVAQIYRLMESGVARRILFLVDRRALAAQAVREFAAFNTPTGNKFTQEYEVFSQRFRREDFDEKEPFDPKVLPKEYLTNPQPGHAFVYVATIQRMAINLFGFEEAFPQVAGDAETEDDVEKLDIPNHAFDLIIADECHRGYSATESGTWRRTLQHFDSTKVGLTATPAAHTVAFFGEPVFRYGVERAIREGYLVDYEAFAIQSDVRMKGVFLKEGESVGIVDTETGAEVLDNLEDERQFASSDIEVSITAPDSNRKVIKEIAQYAYQHETETGRFPKILIFAQNDIPHTSHADQLVKICREVFAQGDEFVQKITGSPSVDRPLQKIREFRNRPAPKVVVTVDMLSTGVDIPALEFIVFLRPVKSRILWEQMLGRGTRRCDEIKKSKFVVFDCFNGTLVGYFKGASNFTIESLTKTPLTIRQVIENIYQNVDRPYYVNVLVKRLRRIEKDMSGDARQEFAKWVNQGDIGAFAAAFPVELKRDFDGCMNLLRNPDFQNLLENYPRAKRTFWNARETIDQVSSYEIFRLGKFERPEDYLEAFSKFVQSNEDKITALRILLHQPKDWRPEVLDELRQTLRKNDFNNAHLEKAHKAVYKTLADIISMVKHAAHEQEPILTAEQRVDHALAALASKRNFTPPQQEWLSIVREYLIQNLTLSIEDFDLIPFVGKGGLGRARILFGVELEGIVTEINAALAA